MTTARIKSPTTRVIPYKHTKYLLMLQLLLKLMLYGVALLYQISYNLLRAHNLTTMIITRKKQNEDDYSLKKALFAYNIDILLI